MPPITTWNIYMADGRYLGQATAFAPHPSGALMNKAEAMAFLKAPEFKLTSSIMEGVRVQMFGDTAVATFVTTDKGTIKGRDIGGRYRWNDVWVKMGGKWKVVLTQGTPIMP